MKVIAYTALHYGTDYLGYAIRSVIDHVDDYYVLYAAQGSHGSRTDAICPDTRDQLYTIAQAEAGDKLHWIDGEWSYEGQQRDSIMEYAPDADIILVLDADEIWPEGVASAAVRNLLQAGYHTYRLPMIHLWRSFYRAILHDPAFPIRVICPAASGGDCTFAQVPPIAHMGYAQRSEIVQYKQQVHGHKGEWRHDIDWFQDRFMNPDAVTDLHPVGSDYWNIEDVNPLDYMPDWMALHPYFSMDVIP